MKKLKLSELIEKKLKNKITPDEEILLNKFMDSFQAHSYPEELKGENKKLLENEIFQNILININNKKPGIIYTASRSRYLLRIAASVAAMIIFIFSLVYFLSPAGVNKDNIKWSEVTTSPGEKKVVTFWDDTKITLNAFSKLRYPDNFSGNSREVFLEGEAFFEVSYNSSKPFIVHTGNISTTVLGTKFNINAYNDFDLIRVSLLEGSVKILDTRESHSGNGLILNPDQELIYNTIKDESSVRKFDPLIAAGWKNNLIVFNDEHLDNIIKVLEKAYAVNFVFEDDSFLSLKLTARFDKASLWTVTKVISKLTGLDYTTDTPKGEPIKITFSKN